jgi:hypothetical protein
VVDRVPQGALNDRSECSSPNGKPGTGARMIIGDLWWM